MEWILVGVIIIALIVMIWGYLSKCPDCEKWWAAEKTWSRLLEKDGNYQTVTRRDIIKNSRGEKIGETARKEQIYVTTYTYKNYFCCKKCDYSWETISQKRSEG
jgi:hypothetical protein